MSLKEGKQPTADELHRERKQREKRHEKARIAAMGHAMAHLANVSLKAAVEQHPIQSLIMPEELATLREAIKILDRIPERADVEFHDALI